MHLQQYRRGKVCSHHATRYSRKKTSVVYLQQNQVLLAMVMGCRTLLRESSDSPTQCCKLVGGWLDYIGVCDASAHGVRGIIVGENEACIPTVYRWEWPQDVKES
jgi:hypothetical protein